MALRVIAGDAGIELRLELEGEALEELALDLADLPEDELADLERTILGDVRLAVGLSRTLRNQRMRERGPLADA